MYFKEYKESMKMGEQALAEGKYDEAITAFSSANKEEPDEEEAK
jgi:cytochrome c-type biogenesis protein CcmH/NrfG